MGSLLARGLGNERVFLTVEAFDRIRITTIQLTSASLSGPPPASNRCMPPRHGQPFSGATAPPVASDSFEAPEAVGEPGDTNIYVQ